MLNIGEFILSGEDNKLNLFESNSDLCNHYVFDNSELSKIHDLSEIKFDIGLFIKEKYEKNNIT